MPSPFPGMDPYLERRNVWPDVHSALIVATRDALPGGASYYVAIEERMYIVALDSAEFMGGRMWPSLLRRWRRALSVRLTPLRPWPVWLKQ